MNSPDEAIREWKSTTQPLESMIECRDVVRDFLHVVEWNPGRLIELEEEEIGK